MIFSAGETSEVSLPLAARSIISRQISRRVRALQIHDCYLLLMKLRKGMTVIDQHALHERILYEVFRRGVHSKAWNRSDCSSRVPIFPWAFGDPACSSIAGKRLDQLGFEICESRHGTILLSASGNARKTNQEQCFVIWRNNWSLHHWKVLIAIFWMSTDMMVVRRL